MAVLRFPPNEQNITGEAEVRAKLTELGIDYEPVSYTHLDVYKRQV